MKFSTGVIFPKCEAPAASSAIAARPFFSTRYNDIYFHCENPEAEKEFVFIHGNALPARLHTNANLVIAELGFGFGLNCALCIAMAAEAQFRGTLHFFSVDEELPETDSIAALLPKLSRAQRAYKALWSERDALAAGKAIEILGTTVQVFRGQAIDFLHAADFCADAWFFDGFAPAKNPAMWSAEVLRLAASRTRTGGTFATYSSAGWVKRNLVAAGFTVNKVPGFAGKRAMLVGEKR